MKRKYKYLTTIFFFLFLESFVFAQSAPQGVRLFKQGKVAEAIPFLEEDINSGKALPVEYNYLGLAYYKTKEYAKAAEIFEKGTVIIGTDKKLLYFNMGNAYFALGNFEKALESFSMAAIADPQYAEPVLNKANAEIELDRLQEAAADYKRYIIMRPDSPQRPQIEKIISMIEAEIGAREEAARIAADQAARLAEEEARIAAERARQERLAAERQAAAERLAEEERLAAERRAAAEREAAKRRAEEELAAAQRRAEEERLAAEKRAEEERRRKLLEEVANSLMQNSDATNMTADAESTMDYIYDSDIE